MVYGNGQTHYLASGLTSDWLILFAAIPQSRLPGCNLEFNPPIRFDRIGEPSLLSNKITDADYIQSTAGSWRILYTIQLTQFKRDLVKTDADCVRNARDGFKISMGSRSKSEESYSYTRTGWGWLVRGERRAGIGPCRILATLVVWVRVFYRK